MAIFVIDWSFHAEKSRQNMYEHPANPWCHRVGLRGPEVNIKHYDRHAYAAIKIFLFLFLVLKRNSKPDYIRQLLKFLTYIHLLEKGGSKMKSVLCIFTLVYFYDKQSFQHLLTLFFDFHIQVTEMGGCSILSFSNFPIFAALLWPDSETT